MTLKRTARAEFNRENGPRQDGGGAACANAAALKDGAKPHQVSKASLIRAGRVVVAVVLLVALVALVGWATGLEELTRVHPAWPPMTPWTALWLAALGAAILLQSGSPSSARVLAGSVLAAVVGAISVVVIAEYVSGRSFGIDQMWFGQSVRAVQSSWPGRPSPQTAGSTLLLSAAVALTRLTRSPATIVREVCLIAAAATPLVTVLAYLFETLRLVQIDASTGMSLMTATGLLLLCGAKLLLRPDRGPVGWLFDRPNRWILIRLVGVVASIPIFIGLSRRMFLALGLGEGVGLTLSTAVGTVIAGSMVFYLGRREQRFLEAIESDRALLRANADGMLDPQVLLEAVRDAGGRVVDFRYRSANRAVCDSLDVAERDLLGRSAAETLPIFADEKLMARYARCIRDGDPVIMHDVANPQEAPEDARRYDTSATRAGVNLISITWSDVTERFQYTQRIAASERNYRLLAENVGDVVCHIRDGRFVWVSHSVEEALGAPPDHWLGRRVSEILPKKDHSAHFAAWRKLSEGATMHDRVQIISMDGVTHWFHLYARPFYDDDGRQDGVTAAFRLIDDEVAAQEEADEARRQQAKADLLYRHSMDNAAIGMCLISPDGRFEDVNPALCQLFGYDAPTLKEKTFQELTAPDYLEVDLTKFNEVLEGRLDSYRILKQYLHADGHRIWGDLSVSCIRDEQGGVEHFISQIIDVTRLVEANERNSVLAQSLQRQTDLLTAELDSAAAYMSSILPRGLTGKVSVSSRYLPSQELGGDCFDYTWIDDDHLFVYLIDVSGHGVEPALLSVSLHNMLRSGSLEPDTMLAPHAVLVELNRLFQMEQHNHHYFTCWCGVYEASTRTLRYASGGAPPAFAFNSEGGTTAAITQLATDSAPVGMFEDTAFTSRTYQVPSGCRILIYSDGASELTLADDRQLSFAEFRTLASQLAGSPDSSLDELANELQALTAAHAFEDDCSLIQLTFD